jgi:hypothetical protein
MAAIWTAWFAVFVLAFAGLETWALKTGRKTLSRCVWNLGQEFPLFWIVLGMVAGGLFVHFSWHWPACPVPGAPL